LGGSDGEKLNFTGVKWMKTDIDQYMEERELDALFITGPARHNPSMVYFTGIVHVTQAYLIKKRRQSPILFHSSMERDEAARSGVQTKNLDDYEILKLIKEAGGDSNKARALLFGRMFEEFEVGGRIGIYGKIELGPTLSTLRLVEESQPNIRFIGEDTENAVLMKARATKDEDEIARIREMGKITTGVVADVAGFLTSHQVKEGVLIDRHGDALTIGEVKKRINLWLAMRGADNPEETIFAIGRDAGIPHSSGTYSDPIPVGQTIIFDIFPCEVGGGYFYDFTRTWCLGYATDEVQEVYQDVYDVYHGVLQEMKANASCREQQVKTCEMFEARGHKSPLNTPGTQEGYVHTLGHGVGLNVHEGPWFSQAESNEDILAPGSVFTHEPGLYYPERGLGVRLEDTLWVRPDGTMEVFVDYPQDLVLKIPGY
jgi:Xaa-Pro aminopeptidase